MSGFAIRVGVGLIILFTLVACGGDEPAEPTVVPVVPETGGDVQEPVATVEVMATEILDPTVSAPTPDGDACNLLEPADIEAAAFDEFAVGEPQPGNEVPLFLGEANSCAWELGNPGADFRERVYLYVFDLGDENPDSAFEGQARRMSNAAEPSESVGDRAMYSQRTASLLVLDDGFLFYLRADKLGPTEETEAKVIELARVVLKRR